MIVLPSQVWSLWQPGVPTLPVFFFILGSLEERMQKLQSLQAARHEFFLVFSQRFFCWKPGWRNWSDFSLNHHIFLGTVVWCCYPWDASPWFHKVCCRESVPFSGFAVFNGIHILPKNGARRVQSEICAGLRCAKVSQDAGGLVATFIRHYGCGFMMLYA